MSNKLLVALILLAGSVAAGLLSSFEREHRPVIEVPSESLDFGTVLVHNDLRRKVSFFNSRGEPTVVRQLRASCRCMGLSSASFVIPARGKTDVLVRVDLSPSSLTERDGRECTPTEWPFSVSVVAHVLGGDPIHWVLRGVVESPLVFSDAELTLPSGSVVCLGGSKTVTTTSAADHSLHIRCMRPVEDMEVTCVSKVASARLTPAADDSDSGFVLEIDPDEVLQPGRYQFDVVVSAVTQEKRQAAVRIPITMYVVDDIEVSPATVHLGYVPVGSAATRTVTVRSRLDQPFTIENLEHDDDLKVEVTVADDPSQKRQLRVMLQSDREGYRQHRVRMRIHYSALPLSTNCELYVVYVGEIPDA